MPTILAIGPHLDFLSGVAVGTVLGLLIALAIGPAVAFALARRDWERASRETKLSEELLARVSILSDHGGAEAPADTQPPATA